MQNALQKLGRQFESVTYYGDGLWDRDAAARLGWKFVPVGLELGGLVEYSPQQGGTGGLETLTQRMRHSRAGGNPDWIPACAGMTEWPAFSQRRSLSAPKECTAEQTVPLAGAEVKIGIQLRAKCWVIGCGEIRVTQ